MMGLRCSARRGGRCARVRRVGEFTPGVPRSAGVRSESRPGAGENADVSPDENPTRSAFRLERFSPGRVAHLAYGSTRGKPPASLVLAGRGSVPRPIAGSLFDAAHDERRPTRLVRSTEPAPAVAVEVFVEPEHVSPVWIPGESRV